MRLPTAITLHKASNSLGLSYGPQEHYRLPAEYLRVHSPSAEVQGHGRPILQHGKCHVRLERIEPAGQYALKLVFSDGHDSGLFTWDYLEELATHQTQYWHDYLQQLRKAGKFRDPDQSCVNLQL